MEYPAANPAAPYTPGIAQSSLGSGWGDGSMYRLRKSWSSIYMATREPLLCVSFGLPGAADWGRSAHDPLSNLPPRHYKDACWCPVNSGLKFAVGTLGKGTDTALYLWEGILPTVPLRSLEIWPFPLWFSAFRPARGRQHFLPPAPAAM